MPHIADGPEAFRVEEIPLYPPSGTGEHLFVRVEKRMRTTEEIVRVLARHAGAKPAQVGYAGRKDRIAVATQWLSVPGLAPGAALRIEEDGLRVLDAVPHEHRLRTGDLRGNRFTIRIDGVDDASAATTARRLEACRRTGLSNLFGPQRFGRDGDNADRGRELLAGGEVPRDRRAARFLLSALQAELFNAVAMDRPLALDDVEAGDVACVHASGGLFVVEDVERERARARAFEISATGPIFGRRMRAPQGAPADREAAVRAELGIPSDRDLRAPPGVRLRGARRPLRVPIGDAGLERLTPESLSVRFELPAGSYATVCLEMLCGARRRGSDDREGSLAYSRSGPRAAPQPSGGTP